MYTIAKLIKKKKKQKKKLAEDQTQSKQQIGSSPESNKQHSARQYSYDTQNQIVETMINNSDQVTQFDKCGLSQKSKLIDQRQIAQHSPRSRDHSKFTSNTPHAFERQEDVLSDSAIDPMKIVHFTSRNDEQDHNRNSPFDQGKIKELQKEIHQQVREEVKKVYMKSKTQKMQKNADLSICTKKDENHPPDQVMNLYDKSVKEKSVEIQKRAEQPRDSTSFLLEALANVDHAQQISEQSSSGLGSYANNPNAPQVISMTDKGDEEWPRQQKPTKKLQDKRKALYAGRKSNSQNQIRNEQLKDEIKTSLQNEQQIFKIDLNVFNQESLPHTGIDQPSPDPSNQKTETFEVANLVPVNQLSEMQRLFHEQVEVVNNQIVDDKPSNYNMVSKQFLEQNGLIGFDLMDCFEQANLQHQVDDSQQIESNQMFDINDQSISLNQNKNLIESGSFSNENTDLVSYFTGNHRHKLQIRSNLENLDPQNQDLIIQQQQSNDSQKKTGNIDLFKKQINYKISSKLISNHLDQNLDQDQQLFVKNQIYYELKEDRQRMQSNIQKVAKLVVDLTQLEVASCFELDKKIQSSQNIQECSQFFLNSRIGYLARKIPSRDLGHVMGMIDHINSSNDSKQNQLQTPNKQLDSDLMAHSKFTSAKFQKYTVTHKPSYQYNEETQQQIEPNFGQNIKGNQNRNDNKQIYDDLHQSNSSLTLQLCEILKNQPIDHHHIVMHVLKLRIDCMSLNQHLSILRASDKLLKKKIQFNQYFASFSSCHSSLLTSDANIYRNPKDNQRQGDYFKSDALGIPYTDIARSDRSQSSKMHKSFAPSFQDSHFKPLLMKQQDQGNQLYYDISHTDQFSLKERKLTDVGNNQKAGKRAPKRQLIKHGTVEVMNGQIYYPDGQNPTGESATAQQLLHTTKLDSNLKQRLEVTEVNLGNQAQGSNTHKQTSSDVIKDSEGRYLNLTNNLGLSTIDKAPTPYFKLQTPGKLFSKSIMTFNSQSRYHHSVGSISNGNLNRAQDHLDNISNDSSDLSALINAKNIGLNGEILNNRRTIRYRSIVEELQNEKIAKANILQMMKKGPLLQQLMQRLGTTKRQPGGSVDQIIGDISSETLIFLKADELKARETEMLMLLRLNIYFASSLKHKRDINQNVSMDILNLKQLTSSYHEEQTAHRPSKHFQNKNDLFQLILDDKQFNKSKKKSLVLMKSQRHENHFFLNKSLRIREYKHLNIVELSNQIDAFELQIKVTTESFIKQLRERFQYNKYMVVHPERIATLNAEFDKLFKQLLDQNLYVHIFKLKSNQPVATDIQGVMQNNQRMQLNLQKLQSKPIFVKEDYNQWVKNRLWSVSRLQSIRSEYMYNCQLKVFMDSEGWLLRQFLQMDPKPKNMKMDSDLDDSSLLSDQVRSIYSSSICSMKDNSVDSSCDDINFNNLHNINVVHNDFSPLAILGKVIIKKNANWEIFKVLSQSKMDKIKNKIMVNPCEKSNLRETLIEERIKTIRKIATDALEIGLSHKGLFKIASEESSDLDSDLSLKQTSKYMYVERMQEFIHVQMNNNQDLTQQRPMLISYDAQSQRRDANSKEQSAKQQDFMRNVDVDRVYGFRYNQLVDEQINQQNDQTSPNTGDKVVRSKQREKYKGNGMIKLLNGMPLSLDDEPVDLFCHLLHGKSKQRALEHQKLVQGYYQEIRKNLRDKQYNENKIIEYRRSYCMNEKELDDDHGTYLRQLQQLKLKKYTYIRSKQCAFSTNVTKFIDKQYSIPFRDYYIRDFNQKHIDAFEIENLQKARENHMRNPWVGYKGQDFVLHYKLQSHGSFKQLKQLREQMECMQECLDDIDLYSMSLDEEDGYPIYLLFEVIHVYRIQERDQVERSSNIACKLAMALRRKREIEQQMMKTAQGEQRHGQQHWKLQGVRK